MENSIDILIEIIKQQAKIFILEMGEFYPFGSCLDRNNAIIPIGAFIEGNNPSVAELLDLIERRIQDGIKNGDFKIGCIAVNVTIRENGQVFDALQIGFLVPNDLHIDKQYFKYVISENDVIFTSG